MGQGSRAAGAGGGEGVQYSVGTRKTIQSIKEIVGDHSEADIYAALKEAGMDPNEAASKLLSQDTFQEVRRKRDKKENANHKGSVELKRHIENTTKLPKTSNTQVQIYRRGKYARNTSLGISNQFRIVRDNRVKQHTNEDAEQELCHAIPRTEQETSNITTRNTNSQGHVPDRNLAPDPRSLVESNSKSCYMQMKGAHQVGSNSYLVQRKGLQKSEMHVASMPSSSSVGVYSSSLDPVHVPSPESRAAGTVGAIRREVGVVGIRRLSFEISDSPTVAPEGNDSSLHSEFTRQDNVVSKSSELNQVLKSGPLVSSGLIGGSPSNNQYSTKTHQPVEHQKAMQSNMEWKPKLSQKPSIVASDLIPTPTTVSDNSISSDLNVEVSSMSDMLSQVNLYENEHVIIPHHLRVPEAERASLTFGSFGAGFDSPTDFVSAIQEFEYINSSKDEQNTRTLPSVCAVAGEDVSAEDKLDSANDVPRSSLSNSPETATTYESSPNEAADTAKLQNSEEYAEVRLLDGHNLSQSSQEQHQFQTNFNIPRFSETYDTESIHEVQFHRTAAADPVQGQELATPQETSSMMQPGSYAVNSNLPSTIAALQQQRLFAQQQSLAHLYPQVPFPHFTNYMPYRQILPPMCVQQMAVPNYSTNPAYSHPSNGSSYLLMPGASSQINASGVKYRASLFKTVPTSSPIGYGNYTNPAAYSMNTPGNPSGVSTFDYVSRIKYKDNNFFVPNPQAELSEIWVQSSRDLPVMQPAPYYNIPGQVQHASFMPTHGSHAPLNSAQQSSHMFHHGLYQSPQPAAIASTHHLLQQIPPGLGGNVGMPMAAQAAQVGAYQQPQLGHPSWTGNF